MVASQAGETKIFENWWLSWFETEMPDCSTEERSAMPGFLTPDEMKEARTALPDRFDTVFVAMMTKHHKGAVRMANRMWHSRGDPRLRIMAHAIRHEQQGEIALMHGVTGIAAVTAATRNMLGDYSN
jgi:uncharacterized protein (DUF305 family)